MTIDSAMLARIGAIEVRGDCSAIRWDGVTADSRKARPGSIFVAIRGERHDGNTFLPLAVQAGAPAVVAETLPADLRVPCIRVRDPRAALGILASAACGDPSDALLLVGITGTDGKSSTAFMCEAGFEACGLAAGLVGTIEYRYGGRSIPAPMTTPDPETLQSLLRDMVSAGVGAVAMEVSSHALDQRRVEGCRFTAAVFSNLTRDHLDYHKTHEAYGLAKLRLFTEVLPASGRARGAVVFGDDPFAARIIEDCPLSVLTFSGRRGGGDIFPARSSFTLNGIEAEVFTPWGTVSVSSPLVGRHNLSNIMAAVGVAGLLGLPVDRFAAGVSGLARIPGRLERVAGMRPVMVFVDYAHTPKAIENALRVLRELAGGVRMVTVMGAGGDRDRGKRPLMGQAAAAMSDHVVVTSDNPRTEDPMAIIGQIVSGIDEARASGLKAAPFTVQEDRREAIFQAVSMAGDGGVVLVAGKGHEEIQVVGTERHPFSDVAVAREALG